MKKFLAIVASVLLIVACGGFEPAGLPCEENCTFGTCIDNVCVVECHGDSCRFGARCPSSVPCRLICDGDCWGPIDCSVAGSCDVRCAPGHCTGDINCGGETCNVECGKGGCNGKIYCNATEWCHVKCAGEACNSKIETYTLDTKIDCPKTSCNSSIVCGGPDESTCKVSCETGACNFGTVCCSATSCDITGPKVECGAGDGG